MRDAVIVEAVRSPMGKGKPGGALSGLHPVELLGQTIAGLLGRVPGVDPGAVDDVIVGCVSQVGEQAAIGRMGWLAAGFPEHVPAVTIDRKCGSSQQAVHFAAQGVIAGSYDIAVAAGVESMSRIRMGLNRLDMDTNGPSVTARYNGLINQGVAAEIVAARWKISREQLDALSAESHRRADEHSSGGKFVGEIVPITVPTEDGGTRAVEVDESIRPGTTVEKLGGLKPAFEDPEMSARFPDIDWSITAGNSSQITDGASALLIMTAEKAAELGLTPKARIHTMTVVGDDPLTMLTAPIPATAKALAKSGLSIGDIDHYEVNEAFASVPLAWQAEFDADPARLNPRGGAIALGHPLGASGCRLMTTMIAALEQTGGRYGLQTMCEAGGMANATIVERLG